MVQYASLLAACLVSSATASTLPSDASLEVRDYKQVSDDGRLHCGIFGSANRDRVNHFVGQMAPGGNIGGAGWSIDPGQCFRVHCYDTSAVYVCNDGKNELKLPATWVSDSVRCISDQCCHDDGYNGLTSARDGVSGQRFYSWMGTDFNVVVAYGNCNDPPEIRPNNAGGFNSVGSSLNGNCHGDIRSGGSSSCR